MRAASSHDSARRWGSPRLCTGQRNKIDALRMAVTPTPFSAASCDSGTTRSAASRSGGQSAGFSTSTARVTDGMNHGLVDPTA